MRVAAAVTRRNFASGSHHSLQGGSFLAQKQDLRSSNIEGRQAVGLCRSCEHGKAEEALIELDGAIHIVNVERGFEDAVNPKHGYSRGEKLSDTVPVRSRFHTIPRKLTSSRVLARNSTDGHLREILISSVRREGITCRASLSGRWVLCCLPEP
jgi:hypothetical protein